jgi:hypothetical protein
MVQPLMFMMMMMMIHSKMVSVLVMKAHRGIEVQLHLVLALTLGGYE